MDERMNEQVECEELDAGYDVWSSEVSADAGDPDLCGE